MAAGGGNSTGNCSTAALQQLSSRITCDVDLVSSFNKSMRQKMWRLNALLLAGSILAGFIVGIGVSGQRCHRFTRFIFLGATLLFLPVISTTVSMGTGSNDYIIPAGFAGLDIGLVAKCDEYIHPSLIVTWASLFQIIMINTSTIVAADDKESRLAGPPFELFVQGFWIVYIGVSYLIGRVSMEFKIIQMVVTIEAMVFALTCAKMVLKYYAFERARRSFALGRNPHLIFAYMQQPSLQAGTNHRTEEPERVTQDAAPPSLLVVGEDKRHMVKQPHGYVFKYDSGTTLRNKNGLVTIDRVWELHSVDLPITTVKQLKDLCLSFALFKLLRCRFAGYDITNAAISKDTFAFFWSLLLLDGGHDRVFQVILDEISFVNDYYYSSLPISYSECWLPPIVGSFIPLLSIACCISAARLLIILMVSSIKDSDIFPLYQVQCYISCIHNLLYSKESYQLYGIWYFDYVTILFLMVLVVITEVRDMVSYVCSNWTKVAVFCHLLNCAPWQKWAGLGLLLRCRCKLTTRHWNEKMGQCSVLGLHPRRTLLGLLWRLLRLPDLKRKVKVPAAVKISIIEVLRRSRSGHLSNGTACLLRRGQVGEAFLWACNNKSASYTILVWHIATSILEVRYPHQPHDQEQGSSSSPIPNINYKIVTTHLSRYCAYLVTWSPELLPDDEAWSRRLYEDVKKDAELVLASFAAEHSLMTPEAKYQQLIELLTANANHEVLKSGSRLGKQLEELMVGGENMVWNLLAEFWSEMILYVAPSDNLKGHSEASIARGGELITVLWVLLFHAGIVSRPGEDDGIPVTSAGVA
jgi:hypothetical protein